MFDIKKERNMGNEKAGVILIHMTFPTISQINNFLQIIIFPLYKMDL